MMFNEKTFLSMSLLQRNLYKNNFLFNTLESTEYNNHLHTLSFYESITNLNKLDCLSKAIINNDICTINFLLTESLSRQDIYNEICFCFQPYNVTETLELHTSIIEECTLVEAVKLNKKDVILYLLYNDVLDYIPSINLVNGGIITVLAQTNNIELLQYLLFSNELKESLDPTFFSYKELIFIFSQQEFESFHDYFIFDYCIEYTLLLKQKLYEKGLIHIIHKFNRRILYQLLHDELTEYNTYINQAKI